MNSIRTVTVATLILSGIAAAQAAEEIPAWRTDGFIMEEIVVTAPAPQIEILCAAFELPEIVVTPVPVLLATRFQNMWDIRHF